MFEAYTRYRQDDPETSREAVEGLDLKEIQQQVYAALDRVGPAGMADFQLNEAFDSTSSTYRTRRSELTEMNIVVDSGRRITRGKSGRRHIVWILSKYAS